MQNKNLIIGVLVAVIVVLIGCFLICRPFHSRGGGMNGYHRMPNGQMMMNHEDMAGMMQNMSQSLAGKTGDEFDEAFLREMIVHHEGAVVMAEQVLTTSKRPELIKLANDIVTAQTSEIKMMKDWQKAWFNK